MRFGGGSCGACHQDKQVWQRPVPLILGLPFAVLLLLFLALLLTI